MMADSKSTRLTMPPGERGYSETRRRAIAWMQSQFDAYVYNEVVPAIRADLPIMVRSGSLLEGVDRCLPRAGHDLSAPRCFYAPICLSGTYDLEP